MHRLNLIEDFLQDFRFAVRCIGKSRVFVAISVLKRISP
jgi:hypothetical protein